MICQMISSFKDPFMKEVSVSLLEACKNPSTKAKDALPQWMFIDLVDKMQIRRNQANYNNCHALIIEFDNKDGEYQSIEEFAEKYKHLAWILHTTSSHTAQVHKYRVILPLDEPTPYAVWHKNTVKNAMQYYFKGIDPSSFSNFQKIPALPKEPSDYRYLVNNGKKFSYSIIAESVRLDELATEIEEKFKASIRAQYDSTLLSNEAIERGREAYKAKVEESMDQMIAELPRRSNGNRYTAFCSAMGRMLNAKFPQGDYIYDENDVKQALKYVYWDQSLDKALRNFARKR